VVALAKGFATNLAPKFVLASLLVDVEVPLVVGTPANGRK
jgi:hypothetical protein